MRFLVIVPILAIIIFSGCAKKDPCLAKWGCKSCSEIFDVYQKNLSNPQKAGEIKECLDRACK